MPATRPQFSSTDTPDLNDARALLATHRGNLRPVMHELDVIQELDARG